MFQIEVRAESGTWLPVDEPYKHGAVAIEDAMVLAANYDGNEGNIRVVPVVES